MTIVQVNPCNLKEHIISERKKAQAELDAAKSELSKWQEKFENYSGNNPDKYQSQIRDAIRRVNSAKATLVGLSILE